MDGVEHYHREMEAAWDYVDANYRADEILGERGSQIVLRLATRASHHEMPYAMSVLAGLVGCTNGASIEVFACGDAARLRGPQGAHLGGLIFIVKFNAQEY